VLKKVAQPANSSHNPPFGKLYTQKTIEY